MNILKGTHKVRNLAILAFAPLFLFVLWLVYYFIILKDFIVQYRMEDHLAMQATTVDNYTPLFILLAINFIIAFIAFLYFVWDIWTRPDVPTGNKIVWVIFLATFNLVAYPVYWYMHVKYDRVRDHASPALS